MAKKKFYFSDETIKNIIVSITNSTPGVESITDNDIEIDDNLQSINVYISCVADVNVYTIAYQVQELIKYRLQKQMENLNKFQVNVIVKSVK